MGDATNERGGARVRVPPPLVFLTFAVLGVVMRWLYPLGVAGTGVRIVGGVILAAGLALNVWSVRPFRRTGQKPLPGNPAPSLIIDGPYRFSRNPMYLSVVLVVTGASLLAANAWIALFVAPAIAVVHYTSVVKEEAYLDERFGEAYRQYKARVRRYL
jgi:protein-S-isoprenylcysteine O-methyltransferase Ste14